MKAYDVTTLDEVYTINAKTEGDARSKICNNFGVNPDRIVEVKKLERKINLVIEGKSEHIHETVEKISSAIDQSSAEVEYRSNDSIIQELPDENAKRIAVDRWDDITMRITGLDDHVDGDGVDISPGMIADDNSVVEIIANGEIIFRSIKQ